MHCSYNLVGNIEPHPLPPIPRIHAVSEEQVDAEYPNFVSEYLTNNKPCVVSCGDQILDKWPAFTSWTIKGTAINFGYLKDIYGDVDISVTNVTSEMSMEYGEMDCQSMKLKEYVKYWEEYIEQGHPTSSPCLYLKDWHLLKNCGQAKEPPYKPLKFFSSDWLNETYEEDDDDFRFAYMGPKGSWTPFHADVYGSFSWSINIFGVKRWRLYPPGKEVMFMQNNQLKYNFANPGIEGRDYLEVIQKAGETIFVPSGWHHLVWNESDTISINHNWLNASNICHVFHQLQKALELVKTEIRDLKDMEGWKEQCQLILKANHGMNFASFCEMITKIWESRRKDDPDMIMLKHLLKDHLAADPDLGDDEEFRAKFSQITLTT